MYCTPYVLVTITVKLPLRTGVLCYANRLRPHTCLIRSTVAVGTPVAGRPCPGHRGTRCTMTESSPPGAALFTFSTGLGEKQGPQATKREEGRRHTLFFQLALFCSLPLAAADVGLLGDALHFRGPVKRGGSIQVSNIRCTTNHLVCQCVLAYALRKLS